MPSRPLIAADNFQTVQQWLNVNLIHSHSILTTCDNVRQVLEKKGIYFWFMAAGGYNAVNKSGIIKAISPCYRREIEKESYDLVYLGTAGTGKKGHSNLRERLKWHICTQHTPNAICSGALSTLRAGIGSLLSDDLILPRTEEAVNEVFEKYFKVCWIEYGDDENGLIDSDERTLIKILRPLLNIKNNPNASRAVPANPTQEYCTKRSIVYQQTRNRIGCVKENPEKQKQEKKPTNSPLFSHQILSENDCIEGCIEFTVNKDQSIATVIRGIPGLPEGPCIVICKDSNDPAQIIYAKKNDDGWRRTGTGKQNIYTYFANVDTNLRNQYRWVVIQNEMIEKKIDEITVKVCPDEIVPNRKDMHIFYPSKLGCKSLIILNCASTKINGGGNNLVNDYFDISPMPVIANFRTIRAGIIGKPIFGGTITNPNLLMPAYERYSGNIFKNINWTNVIMRHHEDKLEVIILSALFGVIEFLRTIPKYNVQIGQTIGLWRPSISGAVSQYIKDKGISNVFSCLSNNYAGLLPTIVHPPRPVGNGYQIYVAQWVNKIVDSLG